MSDRGASSHPDSPPPLMTSWKVPYNFMLMICYTDPADIPSHIDTVKKFIELVEKAKVENKTLVWGCYYVSPFEEYFGVGRRVYV
jgi:hypothetical protein